MWRDWISKGWFDWETEGFPYWSPFYHAQSWWNFRHKHNVAFVHYADLLRNPAAEIRRIATLINIEVDESKMGGICERTSFRHMKENLDEINPLMAKHWKDQGSILINKGTNGRWREALTPEGLALYEAAAARSLTPDCRRWLEEGGAPS